MKRHHKAEESKKLLSLCDEYMSLIRHHRDVGMWVDVEPYQRGWHRSFTLRDDIKNRTDVQVIRKLLDLVNTRQHSHREDFKERDYKTRRWVVRDQKLRSIDEKTYQSLNEKEKSYFSYREWCDVAEFTKMKIWHKGYWFHNDWFFVLKIEPAIVTQQWIPDTDVESRLAELKHKIESNNLWPKIYRAQSHSSYHKDYERIHWKYDTLPIDMDDDILAA